MEGKGTEEKGNRREKERDGKRERKMKRREKERDGER